MILSKVSADVLIVASASPSAPSVTWIAPSRTSTCHCPSPSMSKRYELLMPASFDSSAREGRVSKNSLAATKRSFSIGEHKTLPGFGSRKVALDQQLRKAMLRVGEPPPVLLEHLGRGTCRTKLLPLGDDAADLLGQRLDGGRLPHGFCFRHGQHASLYRPA